MRIEDKNRIEERQGKIRSVTIWGVFINFVLMAVKIFSGTLIRSSALVADGFHSLSDLATDFVVLAGTRMSSKPPDEAHPYGHKRFETLATQLVGLILLAVGFGFIWRASSAVFRGEENFPGGWMLVEAGRVQGPTEAVTRDAPFIIAFALWAAYAVAAATREVELRQAVHALSQWLSPGAG